MVDFYRKLWIVYLQVASDVLQLWEDAERSFQFRGIPVELGRVGGLQRVLILRLGQRSADANGRRDLHKYVEPGNLRNLGTKFLDYLHCAHVINAILLVLQSKEDASLINGIADR